MSKATKKTARKKTTKKVRAKKVRTFVDMPRAIDVVQIAKDRALVFNSKRTAWLVFNLLSTKYGLILEVHQGAAKCPAAGKVTLALSSRYFVQVTKGAKSVAEAATLVNEQYDALAKDLDLIVASWKALLNKDEAAKYLDGL